MPFAAPVLGRSISILVKTVAYFSFATFTARMGVSKITSRYVRHWERLGPNSSNRSVVSECHRTQRCHNTPLKLFTQPAPRGPLGDYMKVWHTYLGAREKYNVALGPHRYQVLEMGECQRSCFSIFETLEACHRQREP